ncbi:MAG: MBL fold metallo-hydrolase [Candidatus Brockarchaeota archaeon]|nr:MBL fold metallo-hydrolase [Candidatus Brockarchaeota archaeon]
MRIEPLCSDSMGVRSMATLVETRDLRLLIDPAAAVAPRRYGLPPHPKELEFLEECWRKIASAAKDCEVIVVTHYHYDHHSSTRFLEEIYGGRIVIVKDPENMINFSQRTRASIFLEKIRHIAAQVVTADSKEYVFGETSLEFSNPIPHGPDDKLGYVVEVVIKDSSQSFLYTSDVQGFPLDSQIKFVIDKKPDIIFADGPSTYMLGLNYPFEALETSVENTLKVLRDIFPMEVILDHHLLRDLNWKKNFERFFEEAEKLNIPIGTAAEYVGKSINQLEAFREMLFRVK